MSCLRFCCSRGCPMGFTNNNVSGFPKCYAALNGTVDWNGAQEKCRQLQNNAQLAVIINSTEEQIINRILYNRGTTFVFIKKLLSSNRIALKYLSCIFKTLDHLRTHLVYTLHVHLLFCDSAIVFNYSRLSLQLSLHRMPLNYFQARIRST